MNTLIIRHRGGLNPAEFEVIQADHQTAEPVSIDSPQDCPVKGRPDSNLVKEMAWYLEEFLDYPFSPSTDRARNILDALEDWGQKAFLALFHAGRARDFLKKATQDQRYQDLDLHVASNDPRILQWPWEALRDPEGTYLAVAGRILRRLDKVHALSPVPENLPRDRINILLVTPRPHENDVRYRSISRPLVELIERNNIPAEVHVLRPPTFEQLRKKLHQNPHFFHIIHFDGHGNYQAPDAANQNVSPNTTGHHTYQQGPPEGLLVFEGERNEPDAVTAEKLAALLQEHAVPIVVLNACRSAMLDHRANDPFASVAAAMLRAGSRGVVAMAYSLSVGGAQVFLADFYERLFERGDLVTATWAGRQNMFEKSKRVCARGRYPLSDFLVPVVYQQESFKLPLARPDAPVERQTIQLPGEVDDSIVNPYGFIGRDRELLKLERAIRKETPAILIEGLGGVGKTTLARGFVRWLADTGGLDGCFWIGFQEVRSAEYVINQMGGALFGPNFGSEPMDAKLDALAQVLREHRLMIVWDNFEVVAGIPGSYIAANLSTDDRQILQTLLKKLRGGRSKVLITSRSEERWLGEERLKVGIGGLMGDERWDYCEAILDNLGLKVNRGDPEQVALMNRLGGHPLAMRVVLRQLENRSASQLDQALQSNIASLGPEAEPLYATLRLAVDQLPAERTPLLILLGLHAQFADIGTFELMTQQMEGAWTRDTLEQFFAALSASGVLWHRTQGIYELHPALTGFLRSTLLKDQPAETLDTLSRAFVDIMGSLADRLAPLELHEQRTSFHLHGTNFHFALAEAERLGMETDQAALTQSLAAHAQHTRDFSEAHTLFDRLAKAQKAAGNKKDEAAAYHQLGRIAEEQRDWDVAEKWYTKSLEIKEKLGNEHGAAITYHQLGIIAEEQRDWDVAEEWYTKSLEIEEKLGNEHGAARTYHQLGIIAQEQRDWDVAEEWYTKSLEIFEKLGDEHLAASTYHQLGRIAEEQRDWRVAEKWYTKSLEIEEKMGNEHGAAITYHQLGMIAQEQRDWRVAEKWYTKSLEIKEKLGNEHFAASTYHQLGLLAEAQGDFEISAQWYIKATHRFVRYDDPHSLKIAVGNFAILLSAAPEETRTKLKTLWTDAGLSLPDEATG